MEVRHTCLIYSFILGFVAFLDISKIFYMALWSIYALMSYVFMMNMLDFSITYNPRTDGQSKRTIQIMEDMLRTIGERAMLESVHKTR